MYSILVTRISYHSILKTDDGISMPKHVFKNSCPFFQYSDFDIILSKGGGSCIVRTIFSNISLRATKVM